MKRFLCRPGALLLAGLILALLAPPLRAEPSGLRPRVPLNKNKHHHLSAETLLDRVIVKFHEGTRVRLRGNHLVVLDGDAREIARRKARGLDKDRLEKDLADVHFLIARHSSARGIARLFSRSEEDLAERRARGEERSGRELADLDLFFELKIKAGTTAGEVDDLLDALNALDSVEIAYAQSPPQPASSGPTPNYQGFQGYLQPAPTGVDALYAWTQPGGAGQGVKTVNVEGGWRTTHEDLPSLFFQGGVNLTDPYWVDHGTAVLGLVSAKNNGFGITGVAHGAQAGYSSFSPTSTADAILDAAVAAGPGGVVYFSIHTPGPALATACTCNPGQCHFIPMEYYSDIFDAIATATANGTAVFEIAGNGEANLDDPIYDGMFNRSVRDSGAIVVGASNSWNREPSCFSNWGSRVDLHAWGDSVTTLAYGDLFGSGGTQDRYYTGTFGGTSAAAPIVAGAAADLLGRALAMTSWKLEPDLVREILSTTGTAATGPKNIGKMPNLRAAFDRLAANQPPVASFTFSCASLSCSFAAAASDDHGIAAYAWSFGDTGTASTVAPSHSYGAAGSYTVTLTVTDDFGAQTSASRVVNVTNDAAVGPESYFPVAPCRIFDTRSSDPVVATGGILTSGTARTLQMTGRCNIPPSAKAVAINVVALFPTDRGNLQFYPGNLTGGLTATASVNFGTSNRANNAILRLATNGSGTLGLLPFVANSGQTHLVMDVLGYFAEDLTPGPGSAGLLGFQTLAPCRVNDTRSGAPLAGGVLTPYTARGVCLIPAEAEVGSFLFRVAQPTANGSAVLAPNGIGVPPTSTINFLAGTELQSNSALTQLAATPQDVAVRYAPAGGVTGTTHFVLDTNGYFAAGAPLRFHALTPCRVIDTRSGFNAPALAHGAARTFQVQGQCGVPVGAKAAFLNVIAWTPTASGGITAYAGGALAPAVPTVTFPAGEPVLGNGAIVPLGATPGQDLALLASTAPAGTVHAIVDVFGYFDADPAPTAAFSFNCSGLTCSFDAAASSDSTGIATYSWSFGDSSSSTAIAPGHSFAVSGSYTVTLTVTDHFGQISTRSRAVVVTSETPLPDQGFFTVPACRAIDTRSADPSVAAGGLLTTGGVRNIQISGRCLVPATATAVVANVVALPQGNRGNLQFFPGHLAGGLTPTASVNFGTVNRANNAILRLASDGTLEVSPFVANGGAVHMVVDINGYVSGDVAPVSGASGPLGFQPIDWCRTYETYFSPRLIIGGYPELFSIQEWWCPVPPGSPAAFLNLTIRNPSMGGNVLLYPNGPIVPGTSTINFAAGSPELTNGAFVSLASEAPDLAARYSAADEGVSVYLDVHGYFNATAPLKYHPLTPCRAVDTRSASQGGPAIPTSVERSFRIQGNCGVPVGAKAVFANVISWQPAERGLLYAYMPGGWASYRALSFDPSDPALGNGLILPLAMESTADDLILVPQFLFYGSTGSVDVLVDVFGYFD
jgi:serine protease